MTPILSNIIVAILSLATSAILLVGGYYIKSRRGNRVIFENTKSFNLLDISDFIREDLSITYKKENVESIYLYEYIIRNEGDKDIKNFEATTLISPVDSGTLLEQFIYDELALSVITETSKYEVVGGHCAEMTITRPFLNSVKKYKEEELVLKILSSKEVNITIKAGGEGWYSSYKHILSDEILKKVNSIMFIIYTLMAFGIGGFVCSLALALRFFFVGSLLESILLQIVNIVSFSSLLFYLVKSFRKMVK